MAEVERVCTSKLTLECERQVQILHHWSHFRRKKRMIAYKIHKLAHIRFLQVWWNHLGLPQLTIILWNRVLRAGRIK